MSLREILSVARGQAPADLVLKGARVLDVFSGTWFSSDIAVHEGMIVGVDSGYKGVREITLKGKSVVPGFIDAHVHVESSCMTPNLFEQAVLPCGTTAVICDPHELANVQGVKGLEYFLEASDQSKLFMQVMLSSCVPATHLETNGGGSIDASQLLKLSDHKNALGLAEMMNVPGVLYADPQVLEKLDAFLGQRVDGHAPLLRGMDLSAYACAGISSCHESSELAEAQEKLRKGIAVWIREGSVAKDLHTLLPLLQAHSSAAVGFCTDDRNPLDIASEGHVDYLVREALKSGIDPATVYRAASWSAAKHYGLDQSIKKRSQRLGALAPGFRADILVLGDEKTAAIEQVFCAGKKIDEIEFAKLDTHAQTNSIFANIPEERDLLGPAGNVHVIKVIPGKIITDRYVANSDAPELARLSVLERHGRGLPPANAYVSGFGTQLKGAIASSVGHDSHNLIVVSKDTREMRTALAHLIEIGGGFCVVQNGKVIADLPLPIGGLMTNAPVHTIIQKLKDLREASRSIGCELAEPFLQLAFLSLPVIPSLKLTDRGLVDVDCFSFIPVLAS